MGTIGAEFVPLPEVRLSAVNQDTAFTIGFIKKGYAGRLVTSGGATTPIMTFSIREQPGGTWAVDTGIGSSGVIDLTNASYDTYGELADVINATANWRVRGGVLLRSDLMYDATGKGGLVDGTYYFGCPQEVPILHRTGGAYAAGYYCIGARFSARTLNASGRGNLFRLIEAVGNFSTLAGANIRLYSVNDANKTTSQIYSASWATGAVAVCPDGTTDLVSAPGDDLVVRIETTTAAPVWATTPFAALLRIVGGQYEYGPNAPQGYVRESGV